ncbi:conserved hypothetical protein [Pediculus humanus corporis]|uniref:TLC domain-containing protein n=1 Tax=Pediculus humanus subsp. corporis TaxID=121224 RepID=E0VNV9_PEDHC|nr:uncharacterized protein Phum_PHUM346280 [Pediculus humanus corporis]EEB15065.1 conserved hypothetical protein [Pediculus humanus corporis]
MLWTIIYFTIKLLSNKEPEWTVRTVTALHATIITVLALLDWSYLKEWNVEKLGEPNSMYEEIVLTLTLGYFLFDFIWIINYQTESLAMYFHHGASILCLAVILAKGYSGFEVLVGISGLELTNPCLQARWFLRTYGYQKTWLYAIVESIFMITFITFRIIYGSFLTYNIILHPKCHFVLKLGTISLYSVSWKNKIFDYD